MTVLVAPLDWGLGHATRCLPIIKYLLERKINVIVGSSGRALHLLKAEPNCKGAQFIDLPGYNISYSTGRNMAWSILRQIHKLLKAVRDEHKVLHELIERYSIGAVISDNRYGLWSEKVPTVFITHQLNISAPFGRRVLHWLVRRYVEKYNRCWIPDVADRNNLSGDLSHGFSKPSHCNYIGLLSRFSNSDLSTPSIPKKKLLVLLSGPEPQRTILEEKLKRQLLSVSIPTLLVLGTTEKYERIRLTDYVEQVSYLTSQELAREITEAEIIVARSGYSTIMDLAALRKKSILIPTPGQTEQEYLAQYLEGQNLVFSVSQDNFDLHDALKQVDSIDGFQKEYYANGYKKALDDFILFLNQR